MTFLPRFMMEAPVVLVNIDLYHIGFQLRQEPSRTAVVWFSLQHRELLANKENPEYKTVLRRKISKKSPVTSITFQFTQGLCINTTVHEESRSNKDIDCKKSIIKSQSCLKVRMMHSKLSKLRMYKSCVTSVPLYGSEM